MSDKTFDRVTRAAFSAATLLVAVGYFVRAIKK